MSIHVLDQAIIASLQPMFQQARDRGLWFFHESPGGEEIWCSPDYLEREQAEGRLILAPEHWDLRNPSGYMAKLLREARVLVDEYNAMVARLGLEESIEIVSHSSNPADAR